MTNILLWPIGFYIFLWPFVLPLVCLLVIALVRRFWLRRAAVILAVMIVVSVAPIAWSMATAERFTNGINISALSIYPFSLYALIAALLLRGAVIWAKDRRIKAARSSAERS